MTKRKFHKTTFVIEILSEEPYTGSESLSSIKEAISDGPDSGSITCTEHKVLNGKKAADALVEQGSEPSFFSLDEKGNDVD